MNRHGRLTRNIACRARRINTLRRRAASKADAGLPTWPHARSWGYGPSGIVGVVLIIVIILYLMGRL